MVPAPGDPEHQSQPLPFSTSVEFKATALAWVPAPPFSLPLGVALLPMVRRMEHKAWGVGGRGGTQTWLEAKCPGSPPLDPPPWSGGPSWASWSEGPSEQLHREQEKEKRLGGAGFTGLRKW